MNNEQPVTVIVPILGAPFGLRQAIQGRAVGHTQTHVIVAMQGVDGEVYRHVKREQVVEKKERA